MSQIFNQSLSINLNFTKSQKMKKVSVSLFTLMVLILFCTNVFATSYRVNNNAGTVYNSVVFSNATDAINQAVDGDIIYFDPSNNSYGNITLTKRLTLIGPGYFKSGTDPNFGNPAKISNLTIQSSDCVISGLVISDFKGTLNIYSGSNITIANNYITDSIIFNNGGSGQNFDNIVFTGNYMKSQYVKIGNKTGNVAITNLLIANNYINFYWFFNYTLYYSNNISGIITNNVIDYTLGNKNPYFISYNSGSLIIQNNIFNGHGASYAPIYNYGSSGKWNLLNNIIGIDAGSFNFLNKDLNNIRNVDLTTVFNTTSTTDDGYWQLQKTGGNPAIGAGLFNGETIDCGMFGGSNPYKISGLASIPTITSLSISSDTLTTQSTLEITISATTDHK